MSVRRLNEPVAIPVRTERVEGEAAALRPAQLFNGRSRRWLSVEHVLDTWVVDDRWWTGEAVRRVYFTCQTEDGRVSTVFCDLGDGSWYAQR